MGKMKIYDLAKELNLASKELLQKVKEMGIDAKSHLSSLSDEDVEIIRKSFSEKKSNNENKTKENKNTTNKSKKDEKNTPVIIRREVIIEENNKKDVTKRQEPKQNKNPFVQRNDKKDFNIVYRNRPEKPLTVSELFGLNKDKKKEELKKEQLEQLEKIASDENNQIITG